VKVLHNHWWYLTENKIGIPCEKCGAYSTMVDDEYFIEVTNMENCPVSDEEMS
jgi:hypothetical protein